jgi:D-sedoheptulose 7-phosphate isomerase
MEVVDMKHEAAPCNGDFGPNSSDYSTRDYLELHGRVFEQLRHSDIDQVASKLFQAYDEGRKVYFLGNGGSASLASHFACDLAKGTATSGERRRRFQALSLTDNVALLTAWANDTSYDQVFSEQLRNVLRRGDVVVAISASGNSPNVLLALQVARELEAFNIGLTGFAGGKMRTLCDLCVVVPSDNMQIIEDLHVGIAHAIFTVIRRQISDRRMSEFVQAVGT